MNTNTNAIVTETNTTSTVYTTVHEKLDGYGLVERPNGGISVGEIYNYSNLSWVEFFEGFTKALTKVGGYLTLREQQTAAEEFLKGGENRTAVVHDNHLGVQMIASNIGKEKERKEESAMALAFAKAMKK